MRTIQAKTKKGANVYIVEMGESENMPYNEGACIACGEFAYGVELDARRYECEACGECKVYGIEELLVIGYLRIVSDDRAQAGDADLQLITVAALWMALIFLLGGLWMDGTITLPF